MVSSGAINMGNGTSAVTRSEVPTPTERLDSQNNCITTHNLENVTS